MSLFLLITFTLISAFFSGSETALFSLSSLKLRSYRLSENVRKRQIAHLLEQPLQLLITILMGNVLVNIMVQNFASQIFGTYSSWALTVGVPLALTLIFGEILPKSLGLANNEKIAHSVAPIISFIQLLMSPIRVVLSFITVLVSKGLFFFLKKEKKISKEEIQEALKISEKQGVLAPEETRLLHGIVDLKKKCVKELMRPREEIIYYDLLTPLEELENTFKDKEVSRLPVCQGHLDCILGILSIHTYFVHKLELHEGRDLIPHLLKPYFVPETMRAKNLIRYLDSHQKPLALVVDEYGSITGLITQEDLMEVVVGEISDKRDTDITYTRAGPDTIIASAKLELTEFEKIFSVSLKTSTNMVTLGGWLIESLGTIPKTGTKITKEGFLFHILSADPHRLRRIYVRKLKKPKSKESHG